MTGYEFPLIYCNGDSYSEENYHPTLKNNTYANHVGRHLNGFVVNKSVGGCCNRRIIRTTISDMLSERKNNPNQKIIVLLGLTFDIRSEIWVDDPPVQHPAEESNFRKFQFSQQISWRENLLKGLSIGTKNQHGVESKFLQKLAEGRAFFYSPYAERINLLCDLVMMRRLLESLNINFLIFESPPSEELQSDFLLDQFREELKNDRRFVELDSFSFCAWAHTQGFVPFDSHDLPEIGHYRADAHAALAEQILIPRLKETKQI